MNKYQIEQHNEKILRQLEAIEDIRENLKSLLIKPCEFCSQNKELCDLCEENCWKFFRVTYGVV